MVCDLIPTRYLHGLWVDYTFDCQRRCESAYRFIPKPGHRVFQQFASLTNFELCKQMKRSHIKKNNRVDKEKNKMEDVVRTNTTRIRQGVSGRCTFD